MQIVVNIFGEREGDGRIYEGGNRSQSVRFFTCKNKYPRYGPLKFYKSTL